MSPEIGNDREPVQNDLDRVQLATWKPPAESSLNLLKLTQDTCPAVPGRVTIPTQFPNGGTNEVDCTTYPKTSDAAVSYEDMLDSVVRIRGLRQVDNETRKAWGSGFFMTPDGKVATDFHNVRDTEGLTVITPQGEELKAKIVGVDRRVDLAILQVEQPKDPAAKKFFSPLTLGSSEPLKRGDSVTAWGYPLGMDRLYMSPGGYPALPGGFQGRMSLSEALTTSSKRLEPDKPVDIPSKLMVGENANRQVLESTILANHGNSGGPLLDRDRQVIGVIGLSNIGNSALATPVEDLKKLLAFVNEQQLSKSPRLFFDELDVSRSASIQDSQFRVEDRGKQLEINASYESIFGKMPTSRESLRYKLYD